MAKRRGRSSRPPSRRASARGSRCWSTSRRPHGARKGLADTALRRPTRVTSPGSGRCRQNVVINEVDCGTLNGITKGVIYKGDKVDVALSRSITGRVAATRSSTSSPTSDRRREPAHHRGDRQEDRVHGVREGAGAIAPHLRDPPRICAKCYGMGPLHGPERRGGLAVGIIAPSRSRTRHAAHHADLPHRGIAAKTVEDTKIRAKHKGVLKFNNLKVVTTTRSGGRPQPQRRDPRHR